MFKVDIYIKIRFHGNPRGAGTAAAVVEYIRKGIPEIKTAATEEPDSTENRLALSICSSALNLLKRPCSITVHINNGYVRCTAANGWVEQWKKNNWKKPNGDIPANIKEWQEFLILSKGHIIAWQQYDEKYNNELEEKLNSMEAAKWNVSRDTE